MKNTQYKYIVIIFLFLLIGAFHPDNLHANSSTAGNTVTVNRDSGFNALRSPALMSWQEDDSMGLGFVYSLQAYNNSDGTISAGGPGVDIDVDTNSIFKGSLLFSFVDRRKNHSFGIGIRNMDDSQLSISESNTSIEGSSEINDEKKNNHEHILCTFLFIQVRQQALTRSTGGGWVQQERN